MADDLKDSVSIHQQLLDIQLKTLKNRDSMNKALDFSNDLYKESLDKAKKLTGAEKQVADIEAEIVRNLQKAEIYRASMAKGIKLSAKDMQRLNDADAAAVMLSKQRADIEANIAEILRRQSITMEIMTKLGLGKLIEKVREFNEMWKKSPLLAAAAALGWVFNSIMNTFRSMDEAAANFRRSIGATREGTRDIEANARATAFELAHVGVTAKDFYESVTAVSKTLGTTRAVTKDMGTDMSLFAAQLGISAQTSAGFLKTMAMVGRSTMDAQRDMLYFTQQMSEAAGIPLDDVMNDVAMASKTSFQFLSREPLVLAKAAVEARRMGTSLTEATTSAGRLIQFTSSVKAEMEASVLVGESINLQKAREYAYHKDIVNLNKELLRLSKQVNYEQLDPLQQEAFAAALGKSTGEVEQMLQANREWRNIERQAARSPELKAQLDRYKAMERALKGGAKSQAEIARDALRTKANQAALTRLSQTWHALIQRLAEKFIPAINSVLLFVSEIMAKMNDKWIAWVGLIGGAALGLTVISGLVSRIAGTLIGAIGRGAGKGAEGLLGGVASGIGKFGNMEVVKGILAIGLLGVVLLPFIGAMRLMQGLDWKSLFVAGTALIFFSAAAFALGALFGASGGLGALLFGAGLIGIAALGVALIPLAYAANMAGLGMKNLGEGMKVAIESLAKLSGLSFITVTLQLIKLTSVMKDLNSIMKEMPVIDFTPLERLANAPQINLATTPTQQQVVGTQVASSNKDVVDAIERLRNDLASGAIKANMSVGGAELAAAMGRHYKYTGPTSAGVRA